MVHVSYPRTVAEGIALVRELGQVVGAETRGGALAEALDARHRETRARLAGRRLPRVFYPIWRKPWMTLSRDTYAHHMLADCGGDNVFADRDARYPTVTLEEVARAAPEVILLPDEPYRFRRVHAPGLRGLSRPPRGARRADPPRGRQAADLVRPAHRRGARDRARAPRRGLTRYSTSRIISISTGMPKGSSPIPTAERAWRPLSPNTSTIRSENPLITFGCSPKPSAEFDHAQHLHHALHLVEASEQRSGGAEEIDADLARDLVALFRRDLAPDLALGPGLALHVEGAVARQEEQVADANAGDVVARRLRRGRQGDTQFLDPCFRAHGGLLVRGCRAGAGDEGECGYGRSGERPQGRPAGSAVADRRVIDAHEEERGPVGVGPPHDGVHVERLTLGRTEAQARIAAHRQLFLEPYLGSDGAEVDGVTLEACVRPPRRSPARPPWTAGVSGDPPSNRSCHSPQICVYPGRIPTASQVSHATITARRQAPPMPEPAIPSPAATLALLRDRPAGGLETLLIQRHSKSKFAAGDYVFAGGKVEQDDVPPRRRAPVRRPHRGHGGRPVGRRARAAVRPSATGSAPSARPSRRSACSSPTVPPGRPCASPRPTASASPATGPTARSRTPRSSTCCAPSTSPSPPTSSRYFAHWITPEEQPLRFDTRFFAAMAPAGPGARGGRSRDRQPALAVSEGGDATRLQRNEITLRTPTLKNLELVAAYPSAPEAVAGLGRREVPTIRPRIIRVDGKPVPVLPGDPRWF